MSNKNAVKILVAEDDEGLGSSLCEAVSRHGYTTLYATNAQEALTLVRTQAVQGAIIDCMLPKMNGVELSLKIEEQLGHKLPTVLISGIFKDRSFVRDALKQSNALTFLSKPFEVKEILDVLDQTFDRKEEVIQDAIYTIISNNKPTKREIIKSIEGLERVHGFELPLIYAFLVHAKAGGHLNIVNEKGEVSGISFGEGTVVHVDIKDERSFLGQLLVEQGYVSHSDLVDFTFEASQLPLGERLIQANLLSPHAVPIALAEQMAIRLGRIVLDTTYQMNFSPTKIEPKVPCISEMAFTSYLHDWINSKISTVWFRSFFRSWLDHRIDAGPQFEKVHSLWASPVLSQMEGVRDLVSSGTTIQSLIDMGQYSEDLIYKSVYLLLAKRFVVFSDNVSKVDYRNHLARVKKLTQDVEGKNHFEIFEILGINRNAREHEIHKAYREISKFLHPDKIVGAPKEVQELTGNIFAKVTAAYKVITNPEQRAKYIDELGAKEAKSQMKYEGILDQGKDFLKKGRIQEALQCFSDAEKVMESTSELKLLLLWIKMKGIKEGQMNSVLSDSIEKELSAIPPEDRHAAVYYFVKGLYKRLVGDYELARRNFELAISDDPSMIEAKRELNLITLKSSQEGTRTGITSIFNSIVKRFGS